MLTFLVPFLPFVFVFALINAQKYLDQDDLKFVPCGILASVSLLLLLCALTGW